VSPSIVLAALVAVLVLVGQVEAWTVDPEQAPRALIALCVLVATASLLLVRVTPDVAAILVVGSLVAKDLARGPGEILTLLVCGVVTAFAVGLLLPARRSRLTLLALIALAALGVAVGPEEAPELVFSSIALGAPWFAGTLVRSSREHARTLEELVALREVEARERAQHAVAQERGAIAREIHDMVGHSVSLMVLQAGAANEVLDARPDDARAAIDAIQDVGRVALDDLHRVLGLLRAEGDSEPLPVPGLEQLPGLVESFRRAGLPTECQVDGTVADLPSGISLAAYRIVQEALTNVVRHAGQATAHVRVGRERDELVLEITDDGRGTPAANPAGHGLVGIRERVAMYDGQLRSGPRATGGFAVEARIPLGGRA
jgi:signal transduction histidine kinase